MPTVVNRAISSDCARETSSVGGDMLYVYTRLFERLSIEEPEAREWTMMAAFNIGALLEYGRPQGVSRRADVLGQPDRNPAGPVTSKV